MNPTYPRPLAEFFKQGKCGLVWPFRAGVEIGEIYHAPPKERIVTGAPISRKCFQRIPLKEIRRDSFDYGNFSLIQEGAIEFLLGFKFAPVGISFLGTDHGEELKTAFSSAGVRGVNVIMKGQYKNIDKQTLDTIALEFPVDTDCYKYIGDKENVVVQEVCETDSLKFEFLGVRENKFDIILKALARIGLSYDKKKACGIVLKSDKPMAITYYPLVWNRKEGTFRTEGAFLKEDEYEFRQVGGSLPKHLLNLWSQTPK